jgi:NADPH2:quinone reductase
MRAVTYSEFGYTDVLVVADVPEPHIGPDVIVVETRAVGLNPVDWKVRQGYLEGIVDACLPVIPAWDIAGVVVKVGLDTPEFSVGDEVYAYARKDTVHGGTLADRVAVPVRTAALKPRTLSFEEAAAVPLAGLTAMQTVSRVGVAAGDTVLIHGGAGGVGGFGTQLAVHAGASVVATASESNHHYLRSLGATPIAYGEGLAERALDAAPAGYDVVIDFAGGDSLDSTTEVLKQGGRVISIANPRAATEFGGQYVWARPSVDDLTELARLIDAGLLRVEVAQVFAFEDVVAAFRMLEGGHVRGKVVVRL